MRRLVPYLLAVALLIGCGRVTIPSRGIDRAVIPGGQTQLDQGAVVDVDGLPGIWLAGHRTAAGGPFRNLPGLSVGDEVDYNGTRYVVVDFLSVPQSWPVHYLGTLVLQTSRPGGGAWLWVCEPA